MFHRPSLHLSLQIGLASCSMLRPTVHTRAQARHLEVNEPTPPDHPQLQVSSPNIPGIDYLTLYPPPLLLSQAPSALAWMMASKAPASHAILQSDLTTLYFTLSQLSLLLGQRHNFSPWMMRPCMGWTLPADQSPLSCGCSYRPQAPAVPSARPTLPTSPDLLPSSLPHCSPPTKGHHREISPKPPNEAQLTRLWGFDTRSFFS